MIHFLVAFAVVVLWLLTLHLRPFGRCWACWGRGVRVRKGKRRARKCRLCKGLGRRQRTGSRTVHRIRRQVASSWRSPR